MNDKIALFSKCFGDSENVARAFYNCNDIITLTEYVENRLAALASLIRIKGLTLYGFYIYGVCVSEEFRGKGLFRNIMISAEQYAKSHDADFVCLVPGTGRLFETYQRMGYTEIIIPYSKDKPGNLFIQSSDFKSYAIPSGVSETNNGIFGLAKILKDDFKFETDPIFADYMGDI